MCILCNVTCGYLNFFLFWLLKFLVVGIENSALAQSFLHVHKTLHYENIFPTFESLIKSHRRYIKIYTVTYCFINIIWQVWDLSMQSSWSSIACRVTMTGHTDTVRCLQVDDEKVVSGSYDKSLKVWGIRTGQCRHTLRQENLSMNQLASGVHVLYLLKKWDLKWFFS